MCEFCTKHGEGKKWYLNVKNYSHDLLNDAQRKHYVKDHFFWIDRTYKKYINTIGRLPVHLPVIGTSIRTLLGPSLKALIKRMFIKTHWSQVVPIEDVEKILDFTNSITRVPCVCRKIITGKEARLCFLISLNPEKLGIADIIDKSFFGGPDVSKFETVTQEWTLNFMRESEKKGLIHTIWAQKTPFIGILCNCDLATGCIPMRMIKDGTPFTFRGEYIARINEDSCVGCEACAKICPFNAIQMKKSKAKINIKQCYGCGICRVACKTKAIDLVDRNSIPEVAHMWE